MLKLERSIAALILVLAISWPVKSESQVPPYDLENGNAAIEVVIHTIAIGEFQKNFMRRLAEQNGGSFVDLGR